MYRLLAVLSNFGHMEPRAEPHLILLKQSLLCWPRHPALLTRGPLHMCTWLTAWVHTGGE